jgi:putative hydrolase of the HAD superfamily
MDNHHINPALSTVKRHCDTRKGGVKAIIFDLGNVLIDFDHTIAAKRISRFTDRSPQEIFNLFFDSRLTGLFEEGRISPLEFFSKVKEMLNLKLDYAEFLPIWNEIFFLTEKNQAVYYLAKTLKNRYKMALLSNINILHFDYLKKHFSLFDAFHHIITSFESGFRKPHPSIYQKTFNILEVLPYNVFYTDDRAELAESACRLGIHGFTFKDIEQLKKDLLVSGIRIN